MWIYLDDLNFLNIRMMFLWPTLLNLALWGVQHPDQRCQWIHAGRSVPIGGLADLGHQWSSGCLLISLLGCQFQLQGERNIKKLFTKNIPWAIFIHFWFHSSYMMTWCESPWETFSNSPLISPGCGKVHDALCAVSRTLESNAVVPGGGAVETALSLHLEDPKSRNWCPAVDGRTVL